MLSIFLPFFTFYAVRPSTMCCHLTNTASIVRGIRGRLIALIHNGLILISSSQNIIKPKGGVINIPICHISVNKERREHCTWGSHK